MPHYVSLRDRAMVQLVHQPVRPLVSAIQPQAAVATCILLPNEDEAARFVAIRLGEQLLFQ